MARIPYFYSDTPTAEKISTLESFLLEVEQERKPLLTKRNKIQAQLNTLEACDILARNLRDQYKVELQRENADQL